MMSYNWKSLAVLTVVSVDVVADAADAESRFQGTRSSIVYRSAQGECGDDTGGGNNIYPMVVVVTVLLMLVERQQN